MSSKFIITRYKEKIDWVKNLQNYTVFNKGNRNELDSEIQKNTIDKPNVGKDLEVILSFIIDNYNTPNNIEDIIAFSQGNPFFSNYNIKKSEFPSKILNLNEEGYSKTFEIGKYTGFDYRYNRCGESFSNAAEFNLSEWPKGSPLGNYSLQYNLKNWWENVSGEEYIQKNIIFWGCIFAIRKDLIFRRSIDFYIKLRDPLLNHKNPVETQFIERTWANIFKI